MTFLCEEVKIRLVRRDGSAQVDLTKLSEWEFSSLRSRFGEINMSVDRCPPLDGFLWWCDLIEVQIGGQLAMRYLYRRSRPDGTKREVVGVALAAQLNRRRQTNRTVVGSAMALWVEMFDDANAIEPMFLTPVLASPELGLGLAFQLERKDMMLKLHDELAGVHVTYAEHSGGIESSAVGAENLGPSIQPEWLIAGSNAEPSYEADSMVNEVEIAFTSTLDSFVTWPPDARSDPDRPGCRLQGPTLDFPEIDNEAAAYALAEDVHRRLSLPQVVLEDLLFDPSKVRWSYLVPGRNMVSALPGSVGEICNLDSVTVIGAGSSIDEIVVRFDQADVGSVRKRVAADA